MGHQDTLKTRAFQPPAGNFHNQAIFLDAEAFGLV
jgi:hypothetical protein